jgi:hypothetical protein
VSHIIVMTIHVYKFWCDHTGCPASHEVRHVNLDGARQKLTRAGWSNQCGGLSFCPEHSDSE